MMNVIISNPCTWEGNWANVQADLSLRWAHRSFFGFVMLQLICHLSAYPHFVASRFSAVRLGAGGGLRSLRVAFPGYLFNGFLNRILS